MSIDWNKVKSNAKAKDDQQYAAMKADTEKRGPYSVSTGTSQPTGFTPAQKSEMVRLENQRRQAQVDMDIDTMNALDARMKAIRASAGQQTFADRADENMSGWVKGTAAAYSKAAEDALNFVKHLNTVNSNEYKAARQAEQNAAHYQEMLDRGTWDNGKPLTDADRDHLTMLIQRSGGKVKAASDYLDKVNAPVASAAEKVGGFGDRMVQESGTHNEAARTGATALEKILLDTGNVAADVASDMAGNLIMPGLGTAGRVTRLYGSGSRAAEEKGLGGLGQFGYGATKAALGEATNRLFSGNPILEKATGKGALDDLLFPNLGRTIPGAMVKSSIGETIEETAENLADIPIQKVFFGDKADQVSAKDIGYDALIAAIIGSLTGISGENNSDTRDGEGSTRISQNTPAGDMPADAEGNSIGAAENAAQGVSGGVMEQEAQMLFGQQKAASTGETVNSGKIDPLAQAIADSVSKPQTAKRDILSELLFGGKRVDQSTLTKEQFDAAVSANEQGTVGMDASGKVFQVDPEQHIDRRTADSVGSRGMNAFQFDHPELHSYYRQAAEALIADADLSLQFPMNRSYERTMQGNKVNQSAQASAHLRQAMDETGLSRAEIIDAAQRIVNDHGQENVKAAKQVEIILDAMLTNGWSTMMGDTVGPNQAYIDAKGRIAGSQPTMQSGEELPMMDDGLGAANAGSLNSDYERLQAQSDAFHPEGAYAARPVDVPTTDFDGRNIPKSSSTVMGGQATDAATVQMLEQQIANGELSFDTIHDTDTVARAQATMREKGFDGALEQYRQAVRTNTATKDNTALGQQLLIQAMRSGDTASTAELLALYTRNSTTAAQAMQAQSIFRKLSPEGQLLAVQKAVSDLNAKYGTDVQLDDGDVADFLNAESDEARQEVTRRIVEKAAQSVPGTFRAKYDTLRYLAMLGNPRTHIRNILGNTFFQVPVSVKNRVGAVVEAAASAVTGGKVERTKSIFGATPFGKLAAECRADWTNAKDFLGQSSKYIEGQTSLFNIEQEADAFSNGNLLGRVVNKAADLNSRALEAEDTAAKKWIYTQSLAGYLKANGCKSISDADTALLNRARNYAAEEALRNTFNDRNAASDAVSKLGGAIRSDNPFEKFGGYIVEGVMPFKRTPTNIAVRAVEYSPIGAVLGAVETARGAKSGDMAQVSKGLDRVASGVSGTALLAAGFLAAGAGYVTGGEDDDEKQQGFNDLTGHQSYAFETKNGTSVTLDWLAPEAIPFFVGVELYNQGIDGGVSFDDMWGAVKNASAPMLEMSMLQGLNDTLENVSKAEQRGDSPLGALVVSALTNYATQIFPTIGGQMERSSEAQRMTTYTDKNGNLPTDLQYTIGKVSQKIPGWDYQQIPYIDAWGRTEESGDVLVRSINNLFNPAYVSQVDVDKVEGELQRLANATGDGGVFPARAARYFDVNGKRKDLTADEYQKYAKTLGNTSYQLVKEGTGSAAYRSMSDSEKAAYIDRLYDYADQTAKASISAYKMETWVKNAKSAKQDIGVSPAEYVALYEKYGSSVMSGKAYEKVKQAVSAGLSVDEYVQMKRGADLNGNGSVTKDEAEKALRGAKNRVDLWDLICTTSAKNPYQ